MKSLVVEDEFTSRAILQKILLKKGDCDVAANGTEALEAFKSAMEEKSPYELMCIDIKMPEITGLELVKLIREYEESRGIFGPNGVKIIMVSGLQDKGSILGAFRSGCEAYMIKPIDKKHLLLEMEKLGF